MEPPLTLYGYPISHYCVAADRMLAFKGLPFRTVRVPYHDKRALLAATGQDYVPALVVGRRVVRWKEIPRFLERQRPTPPLYPAGREGVAEVLENWGHQVLEERVWRVVVTRVPHTLPDPVERWVFEELQSRSRGPFPLLERQLPDFRRELYEYLGLVERMLAGRPWLLDEPSVADFGIYGALSPLLAVGEGIPPRFPNLTRWTRGIRALGGERRRGSPRPGSPGAPPARRPSSRRSGS